MIYETELQQALPPTNLLVWWDIILYAIAFIYIFLIFTRYKVYIIKSAYIYNAIGWLCTIYAGLTANWFIGWFAWVAPLSTALIMQFFIFYFEKDKP